MTRDRSPGGPERRVAPRHPIVLPALCARRDGTEFHAVTVDMSADGLRLRSATLPRAEESITCQIRGVGSVEVRVAWASTCDFAVRITGRDPSPGEVARRLVELSRQQAQRTDVVRISRRIVPQRTGVRVTLGDGTGLDAEILNLSVSGVALRLDAPLALGEVIVVGTRYAEVARLIDGGIGAAFVVPLEDGMLGEHTVL